VVIHIKVRSQDRIEGFFTIDKYGKIDILYDIATYYSKYMWISVKFSGQMGNRQNPHWA